MHYFLFTQEIKFFSFFISIFAVDKSLAKLSLKGIVFKERVLILRLEKADCVNIWTNEEETEFAFRVMVSNRGSSWFI